MTGCHQGNEPTALNDSTVLIQQLSSPSHSPRSATMLLNLLDLRHDLHSIAKEDREFKLPIRDSDQRQRGNARRAGTETGKDAQAQQSMSDGSTKGRLRDVGSMQRIMIAGQLGELRNVLRTDLAKLARPAIADLHVFQVQRFGQALVISRSSRACDARFSCAWGGKQRSDDGHAANFFFVTNSDSS
jgi:hypothetical protein